MIVLIDNYDSFTFNLYQALAVLEREVQVVRNDQLDTDAIIQWQPSHIVLSPGPKTPAEAGMCIELVTKSAGKIPLLGVCLGHQAIAVAFGGKVVSAKNILHGKTSKIFHKGEGIFFGIPSPFEATRYHSLAVDETKLPDCLRVTAHTEEGEIMGMQHASYPIYGVQFHPESILTPMGSLLLQNFLFKDG